MTLIRLKKQLDQEVKSVGFAPNDPLFSLFQGMLEQTQNLFNLGKALVCQSGKGIFPFYLKGLDLYQNAEILVTTLQKFILQEEQGTYAQSSGFCLLLHYLHQFLAVFQAIVNDQAIHAFVLRLQTLGDVFLEIRQILEKTGKNSTQIRQDVQLFLQSIAGLIAWDQQFETIRKRFQMYDQELYHAYDNPFVPRTNNDQEDFNHVVKRPIRKNMGRKDSWFYMEHLGEGVAFQQNFSQRPRLVGGTTIRQKEIKCPMERAGVFKSLSVTAIMKTVNMDVLETCVEKLDAHYDVHKWVCRLAQKGMTECLEQILCLSIFSGMKEGDLCFKV